MKKPLYADDLALVTNGKQELQDILEEWNGLGRSERVVSSWGGDGGLADLKKDKKIKG